MFVCLFVADRNDNKNELKMNAPAVSFTIATTENGEIIILPNVSISLTFKHTIKTRHPKTKIIKRKLHKNEQPSGIFGSTDCYYFK